jgi:methionyl-tRNA formyltransferase
VREDGRINWSEPSAVIRHKIRAVTREPGAFTTVSGDPFGIIRAKAGDGSILSHGQVQVTLSGVFVGTGDSTIELIEVQPPGKPAMAAADWGRGLRTPIVFA